MSVVEEYDKTGVYAAKHELKDVLELDLLVHSRIRELALKHGLPEQKAKLENCCDHLMETCYGMDLVTGEFICPKNWRNQNEC